MSSFKPSIFFLLFSFDFLLRFFFFNPLLIARPVLVDPQPALIAPSFFCCCLSHFLIIVIIIIILFSVLFLFFCFFVFG